MFPQIRVQSTLGHWLAAKLNVPLISLDEVYWGPGWKEMPKDEFRCNVSDILQKHQNGWIIDGDYKGKLEELVSGEATDIICKNLHKVRTSFY